MKQGINWVERRRDVKALQNFRPGMEEPDRPGPDMLMLIIYVLSFLGCLFILEWGAYFIMRAIEQFKP